MGIPFGAPTPVSRASPDGSVEASTVVCHFIVSIPLSQMRGVAATPHTLPSGVFEMAFELEFEFEFEFEFVTRGWAHRVASS